MSQKKEGIRAKAVELKNHSQGREEEYLSAPGMSPGVRRRLSYSCRIKYIIWHSNKGLIALLMRFRPDSLCLGYYLAGFRDVFGRLFLESRVADRATDPGVS